MIESKHHSLSIWFFRTFFRWKELLNFRRTLVFKDFDIPENQSVLMLQNHFSWWDGYWSYRISREVFRRKFHVMMLEEQLRRRMFLNRCGVFSVKRNSRDLLRSLNYARNLLRNPGNLVTIYPTGVMQTQHRQLHPFQQGIARLTEDSTSDFAIVLAVILVDYFGFAKPEIRIYLKKHTSGRDLVSLEKAYQAFYQSCVDQQTE